MQSDLKQILKNSGIMQRLRASLKDGKWVDACQTNSQNRIEAHRIVSYRIICNAILLVSSL